MTVPKNILIYMKSGGEATRRKRNSSSLFALWIADPWLWPPGREKLPVHPLHPGGTVDAPLKSSTAFGADESAQIGVDLFSGSAVSGRTQKGTPVAETAVFEETRKEER